MTGLPKKFNLVSFYEEEWETSKKNLLQLKKFCIKEKNHRRKISKIIFNNSNI